MLANKNGARVTRGPTPRHPRLAHRCVTNPGISPSQRLVNRSVPIRTGGSKSIIAHMRIWRVERYRFAAWRTAESCDYGDPTVSGENDQPRRSLNALHKKRRRFASFAARVRARLVAWSH